MTMEQAVLQHCDNKSSSCASACKTKKRSFDVAFLMMPDDKKKSVEVAAPTMTAMTADYREPEKSAFKKIRSFNGAPAAAYHQHEQLAQASVATEATAPNAPTSSSAAAAAAAAAAVFANNYYNSMLLKPAVTTTASDYFRSAPVDSFYRQHPVKMPDSLIITNPLLQTLVLPPSLAALTLPTAQNICAKCNISFRMTSDLVYHMRSHHKNDSAAAASAVTSGGAHSPLGASSSSLNHFHNNNNNNNNNNNFTNKRRREDKLKCPVCSELFRERHHLTRHMTAHQDKDGDDIFYEKKSSNFNSIYQQSK